MKRKKIYLNDLPCCFRRRRRSLFAICFLLHKDEGVEMTGKGEEWWDGCCVEDRRCRTTGPAVHLVEAMGISKETLL